MVIYLPFLPIVASRRYALLEKDPPSFHSFVTLSQRCPLLCEFILAKKKHGLLHSLTINAASSRKSHEHKKVANFCRYIWKIFFIFTKCIWYKMARIDHLLLPTRSMAESRRDKLFPKLCRCCRPPPGAIQWGPSQMVTPRLSNRSFLSNPSFLAI